jgi:MFS family permease
LSYITPLIWIPVGVYLKRNLPETKRFSERVGQEVMDKRIDKKRLANVCTVVFLTNIFIASVSIFQNRYLDDVRGYSAFAVALFTAATSVPAVIGLVIGGRVADARGRRILASTMVPLGAMLFTLSFTFDSVAMWASAIGGGIALAFSYPALAVYRGELFPTSRRSLAGGLIMTSALIGGSIGLIATGQLVDGDLSYGQAITIMAIGPLIASILVYVKFPETAGMELEDINVGDRISDARDLDQRL